MSKQVIIWRTTGTLSANNNAFTGVSTGQFWHPAEVDGTGIWSCAGEFSNLEVTLATAPGVGQSRQFVLRINGADTALTVTISGTATVGTLTGVTVAVAQWDTVSIKSDPTGAPVANINVTLSIDFDSTTAGQQCYGLGSTQAVAVTRTNRLFFPSEATNWTTPNASDIAAIAGTVNAYRVTLQNAILTGSWTFIIYKNGVQQDGAGGTVDTRLVFGVGSPVTQTATFSLSVSPGDVFLFEAQNSAGTSINGVMFGVLFTATTPGQFMLGASDSGNLSNSLTLYGRLTGGNSGAGSTTETAWTVAVGVTPYTLSGLRVQLNGTATSYQFTLRKNTAASALTATVSGGTTASDLVHLVTVAQGDLLAMEIVPTGSPTVRVAGWVLAANATPSVTGSWGFVGTHAGMGFAE